MRSEIQNSALTTQNCSNRFSIHMEPGAAAPLLDLFRKGGVDRDIRLMAAQGVLGLRRFEQIGVCELLAGDDDPEIAEAATALLRLLTPPRAPTPALPRMNQTTTERRFRESLRCRRHSGWRAR
jgi:hypothetical protein